MTLKRLAAAAQRYLTPITIAALLVLAGCGTSKPVDRVLNSAERSQILAMLADDGNESYSSTVDAILANGYSAVWIKGRQGGGEIEGEVKFARCTDIDTLQSCHSAKSDPATPTVWLSAAETIVNGRIYTGVDPRFTAQVADNVVLSCQPAPGAKFQLNRFSFNQIPKLVFGAFTANNTIRTGNKDIDFTDPNTPPGTFAQGIVTWKCDKEGKKTK